MVARVRCFLFAKLIDRAWICYYIGRENLRGGENISSENDRIEEWKFRKFKTRWKITQISSFVENPVRVFNKKSVWHVLFAFIQSLEPMYFSLSRSNISLPFLTRSTTNRVGRHDIYKCKLESIRSYVNKIYIFYTKIKNISINPIVNSTSKL